MSTLSNFSLPLLSGKEQPLSKYEGQVVLVVNTASKCGLTPQFEGLEVLYRSYADRGLVVLGFPCNQFKGQEPGNAEEISSFCAINYGVSFPMFAKIDVNGPGQHALYTWLKQNHPGDIEWNFEKFLINRAGQVSARIAPRNEPLSIAPMIEDLLAKG